MIWILIGMVGAFALMLIALVCVDVHLSDDAEDTIPDLRTIEEVIKAYDKLRARHGDEINKFISRALAVQHEIEYGRAVRNIRADKAKHSQSK